MSNKQSQYNQAIDDVSHLILNFPKPLQELLSEHHVFFKGRPSKEQLANEVVELLRTGDETFSESLEHLIGELTSQEDQFLGIVKGAVGILGGLFKKKRRPRGGSNNAAAAQVAAQAAAAKRDMEMRMRRMREEQEHRRRQEEIRRKLEEERRRNERRMQAEAKKKTNMMLIVGGGVVVLGIGAAILMKSGSPRIPYGTTPMQMPR